MSSPDPNAPSGTTALQHSDEDLNVSSWSGDTPAISQQGDGRRYERGGHPAPAMPAVPITGMGMEGMGIHEYIATPPVLGGRSLAEEIQFVGGSLQHAPLAVEQGNLRDHLERLQDRIAAKKHKTATQDASGASSDVRAASDVRAILDAMSGPSTQEAPSSRPRGRALSAQPLGRRSRHLSVQKELKRAPLKSLRDRSRSNHSRTGDGSRPNTPRSNRSQEVVPARPPPAPARGGNPAPAPPVALAPGGESRRQIVAYEDGLLTGIQVTQGQANATAEAQLALVTSQQHSQFAEAIESIRAAATRDVQRARIEDERQLQALVLSTEQNSTWNADEMRAKLQEAEAAAHSRAVKKEETIFAEAREAVDVARTREAHSAAFATEALRNSEDENAQRARAMSEQQALRAQVDQLNLLNLLGNTQMEAEQRSANRRDAELSASHEEVVASLRRVQAQAETDRISFTRGMMDAHHHLLDAERDAAIAKEAHGRQDIQVRELRASFEREIATARATAASAAAATTLSSIPFQTPSPNVQMAAAGAGLSPSDGSSAPHPKGRGAWARTARGGHPSPAPGPGPEPPPEPGGPPPVTPAKKASRWGKAPGPKVAGGGRPPSDPDPDAEDYWDGAEEGEEEEPAVASSVGEESTTGRLQASQLRLEKKIDDLAKPKAAFDTVLPVRREADKIALPPLPNAGTFWNWKSQMIKNTQAASVIPNRVMGWIMEVDDKTFEELYECPPEFETLDYKLAAALVPLLHGDLQVDYTSLDQEMLSQRKSMKGRQILRMIYDQNITDRRVGKVYTVEDMMRVQLVNDNLRNFASQWRTTEAHQGTKLDRETLFAFYYRQIKTSKKLELDIYEFENMDLDDPKRTIEWLKDRLEKRVQRDLLKANRAQQLRTPVAAVPAAPAPKGKARARGATPNPKGGRRKGGGKGGGGRKGSASRGNTPGPRKGGGKGGRGASLPPCPSNCCYKYWKSGTCDRGATCGWTHERAPNAGSRGSTPRRAGSAGGSNKSKAPCINWSKGECTFNPCRFSHDLPKGQALPATGSAAVPAAKAKPKAEPKKKRSRSKKKKDT